MPYTAATSFKLSMDELVTSLTSKAPFYIRCIKPNGQKKPLTWDDELCQHQVGVKSSMHTDDCCHAHFSLLQTPPTLLTSLTAQLPPRRATLV